MNTVAPSNVSPAESIGIRLTAASPVVPQFVTGEFIYCLSASEDFLVAINNGKPFPLSANTFSGMPAGTRFEKLNFIRKPGAVTDPNDIVCIIGSGDYRTAAFTIEGSLTLAAGQSIKTTPANTLRATAADVVLAAATNTLLVAADPARSQVRVANLSGTDVRLSTDTADLTAGRGYLLKGYAEVAFSLAGALYARSAGTPTLNVSETIF